MKFTMVLIMQLGLTSLANAKPVDKMAQELVKLRAEVENLYNDLETARSDRRNRSQSIGLRISDMEAKIQREEVREAKAKERLVTIEEKMSTKEVQGQELVPVIQSNLTLIKDKIENGMPFRVSERMSAVKDIENITKLSPVKALTQSWSLMEDELRVRKEIGVFRQVVNLDGEQILSEIAKIGMNAIYFRTSDNQMGYVINSGDEYRFVATQSQIERESISSLFESFKQNTRQGQFALPAKSLVQGRML